MIIPQPDLDPLEFFEYTFLAPAHKHRFWKESCCLPRQRDFRQVNTNREIIDGHRTVTLRRDTKYEYDQKCALINLQWKLNKRTGQVDGCYGRLVHSLRLRDEAQHKAWFLTSYDDQAEINFIMFDLDRHYRPEMTPDEMHEVEHFFWMDVGILMEFAKSHGFDVLWTTSPGDVVNSTHIQGLYAWIKLDQAMPVYRLRDLVNRLVDHLGLEKSDGQPVEHNTEHPNRPIRLLGQRYVEVADADVNNSSIAVVEPVRPRGLKRYNVNVHRFAVAIEAWHRLAPVSVDVLFNGLPPSSHAVLMAEDTSTPLVSPPKYIMSTLVDSGSLPPSGNTYSTICQASSRCVHRYRGDRNMEGTIIEAVEALVTDKHGSGHTCTHAHGLRRKVKQVVRRHLVTYRPMAENDMGTATPWRKEHRALEADMDSIPMKPLIAIGCEELAVVLRDMGVSNGTVEFMGRWLEIAKKQHGRVAVKRRSQGQDGVTMIELAGNERRYRKIAREIEQRGLWRRVERHVHCLHRCAQITLSDEVIAAARCTKVLVDGGPEGQIA